MKSLVVAGNVLAVGAVTLLGMFYINTSAVSADSTSYGPVYPSRDMVNIVPGNNPAYVTFPQVEAPGNIVPTCTPTGTTEYQVEHLKYGTDEEKKTTDNLIDVIKGLPTRDSDISVQMSGGYLVTPPMCQTGNVSGATTQTPTSTPQVLGASTTTASVTPAAATLTDTGMPVAVTSALGVALMTSAIAVSRKKAVRA